MKKLQATGIALALIGAFTISTAMAGPEKRWGQKNPEQMLKRMAHHLNLDEAQMEQAKAIRAEMRPHLKELYEERREIRQALGEAVRNGADQSEIDALAQQQGDNYAQLVSKRAEMKGRIHDLLTDEQKQKLEEHREKRMERKQKRRQKMQQRREERRAEKEGA
ncbi:Spy/CpxP family protein refolding chaperone [Porticoccus sp. W117]|uniref:Spy/CpxP family protein refolding chaperone n=1 Tax=Porticoccus sp. W117 TaxID=3054777 RepID=UPI0025930196|nr:Spy/CpxP family protein refolding chaperone [Porticoccus sp. W117]MDM3871490.1 Spy/CpxP family protein refolding chaperone [Porticoccus sp. W117]